MADDGVPRAGVTSVGDVDNTTFPVPVVAVDDAAVIRPVASTVKLVSVYDPAVTLVLTRLTTDPINCKPVPHV